MHKNCSKSKNVKKSHFIDFFFNCWSGGRSEQTRTVSETRSRARSPRHRSTIGKSKELSDIRPRSRLSKSYILWASSAPRWPFFNPIFALWPPQLVTMENTIRFYVPHTFFRVVSAISSHFGALKVVKIAKNSHFGSRFTSILWIQTFKPRFCSHLCIFLSSSILKFPRFPKSQSYFVPKVPFLIVQTVENCLSWKMLNCNQIPKP